jgi:phosphoglucomutase
MADSGKSLFDLLIEIYLKLGFYKEGLISVTRKGKSGAEEIQQLMVDYRNNPPKMINNSLVIKIKDYLLLKETELTTGIEKPIFLPKSNVLQFVLEDGSIISVRPSGTEPKIKFYFGVREMLMSRSEFEKTEHLLDVRIAGIIDSMKLK